MGEGEQRPVDRGLVFSADLLAGGSLAGLGGAGSEAGSGAGRDGRRASPAQVVGGRRLALVEWGWFVPRVLMTETWLWRGLPGWNGEECCVGWGVRREGRPSSVCGLGPGNGASPCREWGPCCAWAQGLTRVRRHKVTPPPPAPVPHLSPLLP